MTARSESLTAKIYSEQYCCLYAYLRICKIRGETPKQMAENFKLSPDAIWYHYRKLEKGKITCDKKPDCMCATIKELEKLMGR